MSFTLPELPYAHDALQPYMSKETLEIHHDKHHQAYVTAGNNLLKDSGLEGKSLEEIVKESYGKNAGLFNNAGQHYNHTHFWQWMKPNGGGTPPAAIGKAIDEAFGSYDQFKDRNGKLAIAKTPNGESPLVHGGTPILGCDVWEHSYYIDYRNRRPDYLKAFLDNLVNWEHVEEMHAKAA